MHAFKQLKPNNKIAKHSVSSFLDLKKSNEFPNNIKLHVELNCQWGSCSAKYINIRTDIDIYKYILYI